jgi:amidase
MTNLTPLLRRPAGPVASGLALVLVLAACGSPGNPQPQALAPFPLEEVGVAEMQERMARGEWSARSLTEAYLDRIAAVDAAGPELRSVLAINPEALARADSMDAERAAGQVRGPMHGIPVLLKDNIGTADRVPTTAGSLALEGVIVSADAFLVARLREAGAVLLGKANLSEWANFRSTASSSGWSGVGGQTRNPYVLDRSPCGSSSGSGAAVAANLAAVAVGTETDGSIVCPAAVNGVVGIKPTVGLVSRAGVIPLAGSQDIAGPMARTVADAALLLGAMVGRDPSDASTLAGPGPVSDYTPFLDSGALAGARIGVVRRAMTGYHAATDALFEDALEAIRAAGATVIDPVELPHQGAYGDAEFTILLHEFKAELNAYLAGQGDRVPVRSLEELIAFNEREAARSMPFFGQELFHMAQATEGVEAAAYLAAKETAGLAAVGIDSVLALHGLDALVAPTGAPAWAIDPVVGDHFLGSSSTPAAVAGYPAITVPMGAVHGLPVGITFFGTAWSEPRLIGLAHAFEARTGHRVPPRFLPTVDTDAPEAGGGR